MPSRPFIRPWNSAALLPLAAALGLASATAAAAQQTTGDGDLEVSGAWMREMPQRGGAAEVYLTLTNRGLRTVELVGARSDMASIETLHETDARSGNTKRMSAVSALRIAPGDSLTLGPGGMHIMLIDLEKPLPAGRALPLRLQFYDGDEISLSVPVLAARAPVPGEQPASQEP